jgi:hypothetical protein
MVSGWQHANGACPRADVLDAARTMIGAQKVAS